MIKTLDSKILFSAGEDGCLFVYQVREDKLITKDGMQDELKNHGLEKINKDGYISGSAINHHEDVAKFYNLVIRKTYEQTGGEIKTNLDDADMNLENRNIMDKDLANIVLVK